MYSAEVTGTAADGFTITNSEAKTEISVEKIWKDASGKALTWPANAVVTVALKNGDTEVKTATLNAETTSYTFENLPKKDSTGADIEYTVEEKSVTGVPEGMYSAEVTGTAADGFTITNSEKTGNLKVTKNLIGAPDDADGKAFTITVQNSDDKYIGSDGSISESVVKLTVSKNKALEIKNLPIGKYKVTELSDDRDIKGYTLDTNGSTLECDGNVEYNKTEEVTLVNKYIQNVEATLSVTKNFTGRTWNEADEFTFTLEAVSGKQGDSELTPDKVPMPDTAGRSVKVSKPEKDGSTNTGTFGAIEYTAEGTYVYTIKEDVPEESEKIKGVAYDSGSYTAIVTVTKSGNSLKAKVEYSKDDESAKIAEFTNKYSAKGEGEIKVKKNLEGRDWTDSDSFTFTLTAVRAVIDGEAIDVEDIPMPADKSIDITKSAEDQTKSFGIINFTKAGEYTYIIKETKGSLGGITYDEAEHTITIKTVDDGQGHIIAAEDSDLIQTAEITNTYSAKGEGEIKVHKVLEGRKWNNGDAFTFTITGKNGAPMPAVSSISITKSDSNQTKSFGKIKFSKAGTYTYIVKESKGSLGGVTYDETDHEVTISVVDNGKGELVAAEGSSLVQTEAFTNTYGAKETKGQIFVQKQLLGRAWTDNDQFTFTLSADKGTPMPAETSVTIRKSDADQTKSFGEIKFTEPGKYTYIVRENKGNISGVNYDTKDHKVTIEVVDDGNGNLVAKDGSALIQTVKITNTTGVKTGDEHNILIPMTGMLAAILALLIMIIRRRKYNA